MAAIELNQKQCAEWSIFLMQIAGSLGRKQMTRMRLEEMGASGIRPGHAAVKATIWDQDGKEFSKVLA